MYPEYMPTYKIEIKTEEVFTSEELESLADDVFFVVTHYTNDSTVVVNATFD